MKKLILSVTMFFVLTASAGNWCAVNNYGSKLCSFYTYYTCMSYVNMSGGYYVYCTLNE